LRNKVNARAKDHFSVVTEINIETALEQLMNLQALSGSGDGKIAIVEKKEPDRYRASNIESTKRIIDYTWDNVF
jgi:hypothetical protein